MKDNLYYQEHAAPRRVSAAKTTAMEAKSLGVDFALNPKSGDDEGYIVKEPIGKLLYTYWMPEKEFEAVHIRTDLYTLNEALLMLLEGALLTRKAWGNNVMLRFDNETLIKEDGTTALTPEESFASRATQITQITIYSDPLTGKPDIVYSTWQPTIGDLFAKDFQTLKIDLNEVRNNQTEK